MFGEWSRAEQGDSVGQVVGNGMEGIEMAKKLTRRQAIRECRELWEEIAESGKDKMEFLLATPAGKKWLDKNYALNCPLCEAAKVDGITDCQNCALHRQYGYSCLKLGYLEYMPGDEDSEWLTVIRGLEIK